ncbi:MAG: hypothetical protein P1V97_28105 [Planctomycetota bacterium]|nr:hypothetical protein [Planctomycetota bacterium]
MKSRQEKIESDDNALKDVRGIIHCHSKQSHDCSGDFDDIAAAAKKCGAQFVILTDHLKEPTLDAGPDGFIDGVLFIPGIETRSEDGSSLLSLGARAKVTPRGTDTEITASIVAGGGLVAIGHPERVIGRGSEAVMGIELMNLHADVKDENKLTLLFRAIFYTPRQLFLSVIDRQEKAINLYDYHAQRGPVAAIASCDAHEAIGFWGWAIDSYERVFQAANTHVLVSRVTKESILEALRLGRSYAACELVEQSTGFSVQVTRGGRNAAMMGGETPLTQQLEYVVRAPVNCEISLYQNGRLCARTQAGTLKYKIKRRGSYRVEATLDGRPWISSSSIRVK